MLQTHYFTIFLIEKTKKKNNFSMSQQLEERTLISLAFVKGFSLGEFICIKEILLKLTERVWKIGGRFYHWDYGRICSEAQDSFNDFRKRKKISLLQKVFNSIPDYKVQRQNESLQNMKVFNSIPDYIVQRKNQSLQNMKRIWHEKYFIWLFF